MQHVKPLDFQAVRVRVCTCVHVRLCSVCVVRSHRQNLAASQAPNARCACCVGWHMGLWRIRRPPCCCALLWEPAARVAQNAGTN